MIPSVVVDTDVVSYIFKGDSRAVLYEPHLIGKLTIVSFMTTHNRSHYLGVEGLTLLSETA